jgi:hypothetical protein
MSSQLVCRFCTQGLGRTNPWTSCSSLSLTESSPCEHEQLRRRLCCPPGAPVCVGLRLQPRGQTQGEQTPARGLHSDSRSTVDEGKTENPTAHVPFSSAQLLFEISAAVFKLSSTDATVRQDLENASGKLKAPNANATAADAERVALSLGVLCTYPHKGAPCHASSTGRLRCY